MTSLFARRVAMGLASVASAAVVVPATASATTKPKSDLGLQCSGSAIEGRGSSFQNPAQLVWVPGFHEGTSADACQGTEIAGKKTTGKPAVAYSQTSTNKGSGACLKGFGAEKHAVEALYIFCGTDEAPNKVQREEIESKLSAGFETTTNAKGELEGALETIPVVQGAVAAIVHLPEGCKASSEVTEKGVLHKLGRLVFDDTTLEGIYAGTINTWKQVVEAQGTGHGNDALTCAHESEEEDPITRVVRTDHSGTTHIFKSFLEQVETSPIPMEAYAEEYFGSKTGCGEHVTFPEESKTWESVSEACQNQRWPTAAKVARNEHVTGNPGVVELVNSTASSIGYADLAVAREYGYFSDLKGTKNALGEEITVSGGENKKGSATKTGEQNARFWAEIQNTKPTETATYVDPSSDGDVAKLASSNCKNTKYIEGEGKEFPPANTRLLWNEAKPSLKEEHYPICGMTYDLAIRQYNYFLSGLGLTEAEGKERATTAENYLLFEVAGSGGGKDVKNHDYEALPKEVIKEAETGVKEIGYKVAE